MRAGPLASEPASGAAIKGLLTHVLRPGKSGSVIFW
jgi:hypothetical protein